MKFLRNLGPLALFCSLQSGEVSVKKLVRFLNDEHGAELAEYAVGTAILVAIALIVYTILGDAVNNKMNAVANEIDE